MHTQRPVRVLIAEDSVLFATVLREILEAEPDMHVVGTAADGAQAVAMCAALAPDLVLMDIKMPRMDGLAATERIMADTPTPVLVVTADPHRDGADLSFRALSAGALDLVTKPSAVPWLGDERDQFLRKVRLLAQVPVVRHQRAGQAPQRLAHAPTPHPQEGRPPVVGIVASTGGPRALARFLGDLPGTFGAPILIVQHIIPGFASHFARWLDSVSDLSVVEARPGQRAEAGRVYVAPDHAHLRIDGALRIRLEGVAAGRGPDGDVLLESLARHAARRAIGIVLSGMGSDGAAGLAAISDHGGLTLVQDRASCVVYGMPQAALDRGVVHHVVPLERLAATVVDRIERLHEQP